MRGAWAVLLALAMIAVSAYAIADVDLTGMSFDELVALRSQVEMAILESEEYKEVEVPIGDWYVGEHIPAGEYRIVPKDYGTYVRVYDDKGKNSSDRIFSEGLTDDESIGRIELQDGTVVEISIGSAVFSPFVGLGF